MQRIATALPDWSILPVSGPDAAAFLHAQLMNDVRVLADRQWQWTGWLTPKGRVRFVGALLREAPDRFLLAVPDWTADGLAEALRRFVFRSKVAFGTGDGWRVAGEPAIAAGTPAPDVAAQSPDGWRLDLGTEAQPRTLHLLAPSAPQPADDAVFVDEWRATDLRLGLPRLAAAQREAYTPQMLSLDRLRAYSLAKGCYPGQEIVSRTHYLGQAKRGLVLVDGQGLAAGAEVVDPAGTVIGTLCSATASGGWALAVLPRERDPGLVLGSGGARLVERPLEGGLQRPV